MMTAAEKPKLSMSSFAENNEMGAQKISVVSDQLNRAHFSGEKQHSSSSFVVDIESFPTRPSDKEHKTPSSRILRSFSRKGSLRGGGEKMTSLSHSSVESPRGSPCSPKTPMALVAVENHVGSDHHHHVTITAADSDTRPHPRRLNTGIIRRPHHHQSPFAVDPRKILFVFATLSSVGSLVLIYFTLAIKKMNEEAGGA
uniref:Uncharacterized protein n=2 Tax=Kalanchoe fedtschenkoi TaxID=63787 RepID=A0A7N0TQV2_KALFE